jgi:HK97 family phage major capsid protein
MSPVLEARATMRACALKAKDVIADTTMTNAEKMTKLDALDADMTKATETIDLYERAARMCKGADASEQERHEVEHIGRSLGAQVIASTEYKDAAAAISGELGGRKRFGQTVELKTTPPAPPVMTEGTTPNVGGFLDGTAGPLIMPNYLPGIVDLQFPELNVAQLFSQGSTSSPVITWIEETEFTNAAAPVAEGGLKPTSSDAIERRMEQVGKIAHLMRITDEMIQDAPGYRSFLDTRMTLGIQLKEASELLNGTGYPGINGLLRHASGFQSTISGSGATSVGPVIEAIFNQVTAIRYRSFINPDTILMNPFDWAKIRLGKDANGQYYAGGPFTGAYGNGGYSNVDSLWGSRVVLTPFLATGTAIVGAFKMAAQLFRRQGIVVEMTNTNNDDFEHNRITVRAEERAALAVYRPNAFGEVALAWS